MCLEYFQKYLDWLRCLPVHNRPFVMMESPLGKVVGSFGWAKGSGKSEYNRDLGGENGHQERIRST